MSTSTEKEPIDIDALMAAMPEDDGACFGLVTKSGTSLVLSDVVSAVCDVGKMTTEVCINTDAIDHEREVILPSGVDLSVYKDNPVVLWDHGKNPMIPFPLGMSEDAEGNFSVYPGEHRIDAVCHWDQHQKTAVQVFGLVHRKALRGASLTALPLQAAKYRDAYGRECKVIEISRMVEWSWTPVPMNPEAVKKSFANNQRMAGLYLDQIAEQAEAIDEVLRNGHIEGSQIIEPLRKSLELFRPQASVRGKGVSFPDPGEERVMSKKAITAEELKAHGPDWVKKAFSELMGEYDEPSQALIKKSYDEMATSEETDDGDVISPEDMAYGAETLSMMHGIYSAIAGELSMRLKKCENESVRKAIQADLDTFTEMKTATEGLFAEQYKGLPPLAAESEDDGGMAEKSLTAFLHVETRSRNSLLAVKNRVERVVKSAMGKLDASHLKLLEQTVKDMDGLVTKSKSFQIPERIKEVEVRVEVPVEVKGEMDPGIAKGLEAIVGGVNALADKLAKLNL